MRQWIERLTSSAKPKHGVEAETFVSLSLKEQADRRGISFYALESIRDSQLDFSVLSYSECCAVPCVIRFDGMQVELISARFEVDALLAMLETRLEKPIRWALADTSTIETLLHKAEKSLSAMDMVASTMPVASAEVDHHALSLKDIADSDSPIIQLVSSLLYDAWKHGASDIHFQTDAHGLQCLWRLDGVLTPVTRRDSRTEAEHIVRRIKILAELDIAEQRIPQDGRLKHTIQGHSVDFRVSVMPSLFGEDVVLRILDKRRLTERQALSLAALGLLPEEQEAIRSLSYLPYGLMMVTGPTGSGKTTSLYALIHEIHKGQDKFITIEDPIEYQLPGVLQIPVNDKKGLTFARGLRSILRHDPDCIMVGEIRDAETLDIAVQAALTGHRVFATLHANDSFEAMGRCLNLGIDLYSFLSALNGVVAQRLIRCVCAECKQDDQLEKLNGYTHEVVVLPDMQPKVGAGCPSCRGTGYQGRHAIAEILRVNAGMKERLLQRNSFTAIRQYAQETGWTSLRQAAWKRVFSGTTTLEELERVTRPEDMQQ